MLASARHVASARRAMPRDACAMTRHARPCLLPFAAMLTRHCHHFDYAALPPPLFIDAAVFRWPCRRRRGRPIRRHFRFSPPPPRVA